jgi:DNA-binding SARP family transcriptional activator
MLLFRLLGGPSLCDNGSTLTGPATQRHRLALLALLASSRSRPQSRDKLVAWLWPERDVEHARNLLNQGVHVLRRAIGEAGIISVQDELRLDPAAVACDVIAFEDAMAAGELERAVGLYTGPFLDGFHLPGASEFEHWVDGERDRLRRVYTRSLETLAEAAEEREEWSRAVERWRGLVTEEPYDARVTLRLMRALERVGDRAGALQQARLHASLLQQEFEAGPDPDVVALADRLRTEPPNGDNHKVAAWSPGTGSNGGSPNAGISTPAQVTTDRFASTPDLAPALDEPRSASPSPGPPLAAEPRRRWVGGRLLILGFIGVGVAGAAALGALLSRHTYPRSLDANLIVVAPFDVFDPKLGLWREGLVDILSRDLDGAGPLRAVSPRVAIRRWSGRAERAEANALGRRTRAGLAVFGQLVESGPDSVRLTATLLDVGGNRSLGEVDLRDALTHMDRLIDSAAVALLRALGRHRPIAAVRQAPFGGTSLPALKEFLRGEQFYRRSAWDSALAHYEAAIALDSTFALAFRRIQLSMGWSPPTKHSFLSPEVYASRAAAFNRGLPTRDSLLIVMDSLRLAMGWDDTAYFVHRRRAFAALEQVARLNPSDPEVWNALGEVRYHEGTPAEFTDGEILATLDRAIQLDPEYGPAYEHTIDLAIGLGRLDLARQYAGSYIDFLSTDIPAQQFRLDVLLLDPTLAASTRAARLIDTSAVEPLAQAAFDLNAWADSGETAIRLARSLALGTHSLAGAPSWFDSLFRKGIFAGALAFRGHFHEARAALPGSPFLVGSPSGGNYPSNPVLDLALLGALPPDSARIAVRALVARESLWPPSGQRYALPWWYADRDTAALTRFESQVVAAARRYPNPVAKAYLRDLAEVARAYLVLVRGDSTEGLRRLAALPDSLCALSNCFFEKFTLAELAAARGRDREAAAIYDRWLRARDWSPLFVLGRLNRARIAERLGDREQAAGLYQYVVDAWRYADPELRPHVAAAQDGLERLAGEPRE